MADDNHTPNNPPLSLSRFLAGLIGPVLLALAVSMVLNRGLVDTMAAELNHEITVILISGVLLLPTGLAILARHRTWSGWPALVTLMGWLAVIGGLVRILLPKQLAGIAPAVVASGAPVVSILVLGLAGAFLTYKAYLETDPTK